MYVDYSRPFYFKKTFFEETRICFLFLLKVLDGNHDRNSEVKHAVYRVLTKYLRFLPQTHQGEVCMRTELFGVTQKPSEFET